MNIFANTKNRVLIYAISIIALTLVSSARAGDPGTPVAHWAFEEGAMQTIFNNINPGTYDGYRGRISTTEATYDSVWTNGLNGSSSALWFTNSQVATITEIADDTNGDRIADSGPFTGSFSMFMRVKLANTDIQQPLISDDDTSGNRGFYTDTQPSSLDGSTYRLGLRVNINSPTNSFFYTTGGIASDIAITNVVSCGFSFLADPNPADASNDGSFQFYVNGQPFGAAKTHNSPYIGVNGTDLVIGNYYHAAAAKGAIIDDIAIWDKALTADEMAYIESNALPQPTPGPGLKPDYPYAHWPFEEGSGEIVTDIRTRNQNDGYLGSSPSDTSLNPTWVAGLNGNSAALQYNDGDLVTINDIANDTNGDRVADSGPFAGTFTLFARVNLPNTNSTPIFNADKEDPVTNRGFYFDMVNCWDDGNGNWHFGSRININSPTNGFWAAKVGTATTPLCTNIHNIAIIFKADPNPADTSNDGRYSLYVDGELFDSVTHNSPYIGVSGNNKFWLARDTFIPSPNKGLIMDDVAIWSKELSDNELYYIINDGIPIEPPSGTLIILK